MSTRTKEGTERPGETEVERDVTKKKEGDAEIEVPQEGTGSDGMLVSLCLSKSSNGSGERGRRWR